MKHKLRDLFNHIITDHKEPNRQGGIDKSELIDASVDAPNL